MSNWIIIGTWKMADKGLKIGSKILSDEGTSYEAIEKSIMEIENFPFFKSVGYGGLPNERGIVELDAAFMRGDNFSIGAIAGIKDFKNPISIAKKLSENKFNSFLIGTGAEEYATINNFERMNMLTPKAKKTWEARVKEVREKNLSPYDGHDTVCVIALDKNQKMAVGTSTSGLFMKKAGRVGDSPLSGSGFYVDDEIGGAAATGLGEDIMKACLSLRTIFEMEKGLSPMEAAQKVIDEFSEKMKKAGKKLGAVSVIALDNKGNWGIGTNVEFTFAVSKPNGQEVYLAKPNEQGKIEIEILDEEYMKKYIDCISQ